MDKLYVYLPEGLLPKIAEIAKKEKRSLSHISVELMKKGIEPAPKSVEDSGCFPMPNDVIEKVNSYAETDKIPPNEAAVSLMRSAIKEKERLKEKYLKSLAKKQ